MKPHVTISFEDRQHNVPDWNGYLPRIGEKVLIQYVFSRIENGEKNEYITLVTLTVKDVHHVPSTDFPQVWIRCSRNIFHRIFQNLK